MKKMYKQPIVETTGLIAGGQALCSSPGNSLQNSGNGTDVITTPPSGEIISD